METRKRFGKLFTHGNMALAVLAVFGVICVIASINAMQRNHTLQALVAEENWRLHQIELELAELEYQRIWRASDEFIELALKRRFNVVADGERIIELPPPSAEILERLAEEEEAETLARSPEELPNWQLWVRYFFGS